MAPFAGAAGIILLATGSICLGAFLGSKKPEPIDDDSDESFNLTWWQVSIMPVSSSIFLLLLFYYFAYIQLILIIFIVVGSGVSCLDVLRNSIAAFTPSLSGTVSSVLSTIFTICVIVIWAANGSFIAHDILGCSLCISSIAVIRFPSLKLAAVCLGLLLLYDIFWVFCSEYFFQKNVMVEVAMKSASNPLQELGTTYHIPLFMSLRPKLELPIKLLVQSSFDAVNSRVMMLGLGDIALPGFLVSFALRCDIFHINKTALPQYSPESLLLRDHESSKKFPTLGRPSSNLFECSIIGYTLGLVLALYIGSVSGHAQPALIYLVPGVIIPITLRAWQKKMLLEVWNGPAKLND